MDWRKWIVRGIAYGIIGAAAAAAFAYERWTNSAAVREQVIAELSKMFPGAQVSIDSARLRILGGIQLNGLRLTRNDDPEKIEFLHVPSAIFFHDKEKILDGELRLRKIELDRPRLRVSRGRDGVWNLANLMRPHKDRPTTAMPAIVIHRGTLVLEDRFHEAKPALVEINDVSLTLVNDPLPTVTVHGAASSELVGTIKIDGTLNRMTSEAQIAFVAARIPLRETMLNRLPLPCPPEVLVGLQIEGTARVEGRIAHQPGQPQPFFYDVRCELKDGKLSHPRLPLSLEKLCMVVGLKDGEARLERLTAVSGATTLEAHGVAKLCCIERDFEIRADLKHLQLGEALAIRLPDKLRDLHQRFEPKGPLSLYIACAKQDGAWAALGNGEPSHVSLRPEGVALAFKHFPYPLEQTTGALDYNFHNRHIKIGLAALAGDRPVLLNGHWTGEGPMADVQLDILAEDVAIDDKLLKALATENLMPMYHFAKSFHATGKVNVVAQIKQEPGQKFRNVYRLFIHDTSLCWDQFPYPLRNVSGNLNIYPDQHWEFHDFQGTHNGGHVLLNGKSTLRVNDKGESTYGISLEITGRDISLDDDLQNALRPLPSMHKSWETFRPQGKLFFTASVVRPSADPSELDVRVDAHGPTLAPTFLAYRLQDVSGQFHFHNNALQITKVRARHDQTRLALDRGKIDIHPRGGYYANLQDIVADGLVMDDEFLKALPPRLFSAAKAINIRDPLKLRTQVVIYQPPETGKPFDVYWDSQIWMQNGRFTTGLEMKDVTGTLACIGRYNGRYLVGVDGNLVLEKASLFDQPFSNVHARFRMHESNPDVMLVNLRAPLFGGDVTGQARVNFNSALSYELNLTASQINVAEFGRHNFGPQSQFAGLAGARLYLTGLGTGGMDTLDGHGAIDIPRGHIYDLPFVLDLLRFLGLSAADRTTFEEFHAAYAIQGSKVNVKRLDLLGSTISLSGKGDIDLGTKKVELDVYPMWGRVEQLLPTQVRPVPTTISKNLLTVEVRGKAGTDARDLKFRMKPMPVLVDPLLLLRDRVLGQTNPDTPEPRGDNVGIPLPAMPDRRP